jgi:cytidylate kinase
MKRVFSIIILAAIILSAFPSDLSAAPQLKEWTLAVFLNADNNLDSFGVEDQEEMARVGSSDFLNIVTLIDRERGPAQINYIEKNNIEKIKDLGEVDMGDYRQLVNFMKFVKTNYPAKHYAITIWNHGSGWKFKKENPIYRGISYDDSSNNHITNSQLGIAMKEIKKLLGKKVDIVNFDACLMQMVEVAYACKDHASYMVASEELEPGKGAPYDDILKVVKPGITPENFAKNWVSAFSKSYNGGSQGYDESTQSALNLSKLGNLTDALSGLAKTTMSGKYARAFNNLLRKVHRFDYPENIDLIHFAELLKAQTKNDIAMQTAVDKVLKASKEVVIASEVTGFSTKDARGIAIYLPFDFIVESKYKKLGFAQDTLWDEMITELMKRNMVDKVIDDINNGSLEALKKLVAFSQRNVSEASLFRFIARELKYAFIHEHKLDPSIESDFYKLVDALIAAR